MSKHRSLNKVAAMLCGATIAVASVIAVGCSPASTANSQPAQAVLSARTTLPANSPMKDANVARRLADECGIQIVRLGLTGGGDMVDLRYIVLDLTKAQASITVKPVKLKDDVTGMEAKVPDMPRVGALRVQKLSVTGKLYYVLFHNPGQRFTDGSKVTLLIGDKSYSGLLINTDDTPIEMSDFSEPQP